MTDSSKNRDPKKSSDGDTLQKGGRVIGEGMTSLDSTQAPLIAETGLPDYAAMKDKDKSTDTSHNTAGTDRKRS